MDLSLAHDILDDAVATRRADIGHTKVCSAIEAVVWQDGQLLVDRAIGRPHLDADTDPVGPHTPMDIASLTKPVVTATLLMQAVDAGLARLDDAVSAHWPAWSDARADGRPATLLDLLNHSSGLAGWEKFYLNYPLTPSPAQAQRTRDALFDHIATRPLAGPAGTRHCYSDLGYILLAGILEKLFGDRLDRLATAQIFEPLGMSDTRFVARLDGTPPLAGAAATERCPRRNRRIAGSVHDQNTEIMGGVSGHAGVFSTGRDLLKFCRHIWRIDSGRLGPHRIGPHRLGPDQIGPDQIGPDQIGPDQIGPDRGLVGQSVLHFCLSERARGADGHHLGGWDTPSGDPSSAGRGFQAGRSVGHLGFTGTSMWIERDRGLIAILLTNRVYPSRDNARIKALRVAFHEAILGPPS